VSIFNAVMAAYNQSCSCLLYSDELMPMHVFDFTRMKECMCVNLTRVKAFLCVQSYPDEGYVRCLCPN
jgi:hypothetical protein